MDQVPAAVDPRLPPASTISILLHFLPAGHPGPALRHECPRRSAASQTQRSDFLRAVDLACSRGVGQFINPGFPSALSSKALFAAPRWSRTLER